MKRDGVSWTAYDFYWNAVNSFGDARLSLLRLQKVLEASGDHELAQRIKTIYTAVGKEYYVLLADDGGVMWEINEPSGSMDVSKYRR